MSTEYNFMINGFPVKTFGEQGFPLNTVVIKHTRMLKESLIEFLAYIKSNKNANNIVGFDISNAFFVDLINAGEKSRVEVLKLCSGHRCLIIQLLHITSIDFSLANFLDNPNITFVGVGIKDKLSQLQSDYGIRCRNVVELGPLAAAVLLKPSLSDFCLANLLNEVCGVNIPKDPAIVVSNDWSAKNLREEQIKDTTIDAFQSFFVGNKLLGGSFLSFYFN